VPTTGPLAHIDISAGRPERSIPFYAALLEALGYRRRDVPLPGLQSPDATRAAWSLRQPGGGHFEIEVRPARPESRDRRYDRYEPGPHHLAFHAESRAVVRRIHEAMVAAGAAVLEPPADYGGRPGYEVGYFAAFYADPDGLKLEVAHIPSANP